MIRALTALMWLAAAAPALAAVPGDAVPGGAVHGLFAFDDAARPGELAAIAAANDPAAAAPLIHLLNWLDAADRPPVAAVLRRLTGAPGESWADWMVWLQNHPEAPVWPETDSVLRDLLLRIDPAFARFLPPGVAHDNRLEEIVWGGVKVDGIPALDHPAVLPAAAATYLNASDRVFGAVVGGQARAWPLRIVNWHEMVNDTLGGIPVSLAYCTLCGAGILFDARVPGQAAPFTFGSSGLLYRSNKLMYDRQTDSLWNQFTGRPVAGKLTGSGIALRPLPLALLPWGEWQRRHPNTTVLSPGTGFKRDYREGASYAAYFASPDLLFPAAVRDAARQKEVDFGVIAPGGVKAWPLARFAGGAVINDRVGFSDVVLVGADGFVRAYDSGGRQFISGGPERLCDAEGGQWTVGDDALTGPDGATLPRLPGHLGYRFAWDGYFAGAVE